MRILHNISVPDDEIDISAVHSSGPGGQNVNKVATAVHLRFDIMGSSLPDNLKKKLSEMNDSRITDDGTIVLKAKRFRSFAKNRADAVARLREIIMKAAIPVRKRRPTKPTRASKERRLQAKNRKSRIKALRRGSIDE